MIMISCSLIYTAMAGGHVFLCSVFFSLFGSYIVSWNVLSHLFLSSHGPFISGHEVTYLTEFQTTSLVIIERFATPSCCQRASFPPELVIKYPTTVSSFQQLRLLLSGDVQLNPDPTALSSSYTMNNSKLSCALLNSLRLLATKQWNSKGQFMATTQINLETKHQQFGTSSTQGYKNHSWEGLF